LFNKFSDIDIINGVRNQDVKVLNWLYDNYLGIIRSYVFNNSGNEQDVYDVFQDTIIILFKQINENTIILTADLKGYFFGIAKNIWNEQLRRIGKTTELTQDFPEETDSDEITNTMMERVVSRAFLKLKADQQEVLNLYSDGLSYDEIAVKMNLKNESYARRKKYLCKEALLDIVKQDPEYQEYLRFRK
jgi:RNA polymerase sigma factor (sigma-70 family)